VATIDKTSVPRKVLKSDYRTQRKSGLHNMPVGRFAKAEYPGGWKVVIMLLNATGCGQLVECKGARWEGVVGGGGAEHRV
jgi:hypothetical protein